MDSGEQEGFARNRVRVAELEWRKARIRQLNDQLRAFGGGGRVMITNGLYDLDIVATALVQVMRFSDFSEANDPHDEHDFGSLEIDGHRVFWKIDYYDKSMDYGSPDPADPDVTARVLTIMLAEEY